MSNLISTITIEIQFDTDCVPLTFVGVVFTHCCSDFVISLETWVRPLVSTTELPEGRWREVAVVKCMTCDITMLLQIVELSAGLTKLRARENEGGRERKREKGRGKKVEEKRE